MRQSLKLDWDEWSMIDEEKQSDNTSPQTRDQPLAVDPENQSEESAATSEDTSVETDLKSLKDWEQPTAEGLTDSVAPLEVGAASAVAAESDTHLSSLDGEVAAILETLQQENQSLSAQLEEINQQCDSFKAQSLRIAADFDNFRKRSAKEKEDLEQQVKRGTLSELLPVVDNFERARSQIKPQNDGEMAIHKSYQGVYKQLVDCLKRLGVSPMRPEGQEFDPNLHEAVMREPTAEHPEGVVIEQLMRGYMLNDRVLRHAMVKVAAAPLAPSEDSASDS